MLARTRLLGPLSLAVAALAVVALTVKPTGTPALSLPAPPEWIWQEAMPDGRSAVHAVGAPGGSARWQRCATTPSGFADCTPVADFDPQTGWLTVGADDAGSAFVATAADGSRGVVVFGGPLRVEAPPSVEGEARVGGTVRAIGAIWTGGFGRERSAVQLQACRDAGARECVTVTDAFHWNRCEETGTVVPARYRGWYLRAVDRPLSEHVFVNDIAYRFPAAIPLQRRGPVTATSQVIGPIADGTVPRGGCTIPPLQAELGLRRTVVLSGGRLLAGRVRCAEPCRTTLVITRGGRRFVSRAEAPAGRWTAVVVPRRTALRLGAETVRLRLRAEGARSSAHRSVLLPRRAIARLARR